LSLQNVPIDPLTTILEGRLPSVDAILQGSIFFAGITLNTEFDILVLTANTDERVEIKNLRPAASYDAYFVLQALQVWDDHKIHARAVIHFRLPKAESQQIC
jgi:hypothetical protein